MNTLAPSVSYVPTKNGFFMLRMTFNSDIHNSSGILVNGPQQINGVPDPANSKVLEFQLSSPPTVPMVWVHATHIFNGMMPKCIKSFWHGSPVAPVTAIDMIDANDALLTKASNDIHLSLLECVK